MKRGDLIVMQEKARRNLDQLHIAATKRDRKNSLFLFHLTDGAIARVK